MSEGNDPVIREGLWDCPNCGNANKGREVKCGGCGQARENVEFYLPEDAEVVKDAEGIAHAKAGADWVCAYCDLSNAAGNASCSQCGAGRDEGKNREQKVILDRPAAAAAAAAKPAVPAPSGGTNPIALVIAGIVALGLLCGVGLGLVSIFGSSEERATVTAMKWSREVPIEEQRWVKDSGWDLPRDARLIRQAREQSGTEKVQVGTERKKVGKKDLGNGMFEDVYKEVPKFEQRPVMRTRYYYEVRRWTETRRERASGQGTDGMRWPVPKLRPGERAGTRKETLTVSIRTKDGKTYDYSAKSEQDYARCSVGSEWIAVISGLGSVSELKPPGATK